MAQHLQLTLEEYGRAHPIAVRVVVPFAILMQAERPESGDDVADLLRRASIEGLGEDVLSNWVVSSEVATEAPQIVHLARLLVLSWAEEAAAKHVAARKAALDRELREAEEAKRAEEERILLSQPVWVESCGWRSGLGARTCPRCQSAKNVECPDMTRRVCRACHSRWNA